MGLILGEDISMLLSVSQGLQASVLTDWQQEMQESIPKLPL